MSTRRTIATFGVGAMAGVAAYAVLTTGVLSTGASTLKGAASGLLRVPSAAAEELPTFDDCEQLRQWYVDSALPQVGPWGIGGLPGMVYADSQRAAGDSALAAGKAETDAVGSSGTGTNVQEADVDEADVAKTDGRLVVRISGDNLVVTDVSGGTARELSRTALPGRRLANPELLLDGDRVLVVGNEETYYYGGPFVLDRIMPSPLPQQDALTHLISFDISDPAAPRVDSHQRVDGGAVSTRHYGDDTVRVVVTTSYPPLDFVNPNRDRTPAQATKQNRAIVRAATIDDWLPAVRTSEGGAKQALLDCGDVRHPLKNAGFGTISVLTFPIDEPSDYDATAVTAAGDLVYSSSDRLYVATAAGGWFEPMPLGEDPGGRESGVNRPAPPRTQVHAFALDDERTTYAASGSVPGLVADRWSFSEYDGHLRVATALGEAWNAAENAVVVLEERDGRLRETGRVDGLGKNEEIQSVRWFGDVAVVVTFRQVDPLYTLDLADPARPRLVGALKIPGFSSYLHPIGGDRLVGVGRNVTPRGEDLGAQVATFDMRDLGDVRRTDTLGFGYQSYIPTDEDPRAFTYLPDERVLVTPVQSWSGGAGEVVALRVSDDGSLTQTASWEARRWGTDLRALPLGGGRVALVGDVVRVVSVR